MLRMISLAALAANVIWLSWIGYAWTVNGFRPQMWQDVLVALTPILSVTALSISVFTSERGLLGLWVERERAKLKRQIDELK